MIKRILIAIALVALLAASASAELTENYLFFGDHHAVKVDGSENVRWPFEYKYLDVCVIPIKMHVGMFVQVFECKKLKVILQQVDCADIGKGSDNYPCYMGCVKFKVRANFEAKMGTSLSDKGSFIADWEAWIKAGNPVAGDGEYHEVEACVKAWKTQIWKALLSEDKVGDEVDVGKLHITVKPNA